MKATFDLMMNKSHTELEKRLEEFPELVKAYDEEGFTLLHQAATHDCPEALQVLIKKGADAIAKGPLGEHPLHLAAYNGNLSCIRLLVKEGAPIEGLDNDGCTPLYFSAMSDDLFAAECLVELGAEVTAEHLTAAGETGSMNVFAFLERNLE